MFKVGELVKLRPEWQHKNLANWYDYGPNDIGVVERNKEYVYVRWPMGNPSGGEWAYHKDQLMYARNGLQKAIKKAKRYGK